ncbi:hypothetical protein SAMN05519104_0805 [Rhizobiales bacterium GAS188]|nr:hypothetical protein SAMN05519104_0805 [Rhizobiales bacterium GAS188]
MSCRERHGRPRTCCGDHIGRDAKPTNLRDVMAGLVPAIHALLPSARFVDPERGGVCETLV